MEFIAGIAVGAAFSKFWLMVWGFASTQLSALMNKSSSTDSTK